MTHGILDGPRTECHSQATPGPRRPPAATDRRRHGTPEPKPLATASRETLVESASLGAGRSSPAGAFSSTGLRVSEHRSCPIARAGRHEVVAGIPLSYREGGLITQPSASTRAGDGDVARKGNAMPAATKLHIGKLEHPEAGVRFALALAEFSARA